MLTKEALIKVDTYFDNKKKWCKTSMWRDKDNKPLLISEENKSKVEKCCLIGAITLITNDANVRMKCETKLRENLDGRFNQSLMFFNDLTTFEEVKALIKRTIEACP